LKVEIKGLGAFKRSRIVFFNPVEHFYLFPRAGVESGSSLLGAGEAGLSLLLVTTIGIFNY